MANRFFRVASELNRLNDRLVRKQQRVLYRTGGYGLRVVRNSIKYDRDESSRPGQIPKSKTRALKRHSRYEVDMRRGELVIGFIKFPSDSAKPLGKPSIPAIINAGGRAKIHFMERRITRPDGSVIEVEPSVRFINYRPRPMLTPHLDAIVAKMKEITQSTPV